MNRVNVRRLATAAFAFLWLGVAFLSAEVKLRIYMQDGSLQAGTLITENDESFVLLGKDGRVEIPKKNIMFINGKTLKQWNDRPDKLFQTEIMPTDVPNPAFVNNKASLPQPVIPPVQKLPVAPVVAATPLAPAVVAPVEPAAVAAAAKPAVETAPPEPKPRHRPRVAAATKAAPAAETPAVVAAAPVPVATPVPTGRRSRKLAERSAKGAVHRERGFAFLAEGKAALAMEQFMIARLLEPDNGDTNLALGKILHTYGQHKRALDVLGHWTLRKSDAAAAEMAAINREIEENARRVFHLQIAAGVGAFAWLPFILLYRRWRRRVVASVAAGTKPVEPEVEEVEATPWVANITKKKDWVKQAEARFSEAAPPVPPPVPIETPPPPPIVEPIPASVAEPTPAVPFEIITEEEILAESPPARPVETAPATPIVEKPVPVEIPEPVREIPVEEPPKAPEPVPEPELEPVAAAPQRFDPREILSMARGVENALVRGNAAAANSQLTEARRSYRTALALNPECASAHLGLAYLAFVEEKWDTSLLHYRKALDIDPKSADAHYGVARVLLEVNKVEEAVPELRATLTIDPTHLDARDALTAIGKPA